MKLSTALVILPFLFNLAKAQGAIDDALTDAFTACINNAVDNGGIKLSKSRTNKWFVSLNCQDSTAETLYNLIAPYKIHEQIGRVPDELGGGMIETIYFGQVTTTHFPRSSIPLHTKANPGSNCYTTHSNGTLSKYGCIIQLDLSSNLAESLDL